MKKSLIFDAGPLINFSMNGLLHVFERLKQEFDGDFLITKEVKEEIIDRPLEIKKFELGALRLKQLFDKGVIKHADITTEQVNELKHIREDLMQKANNTFKSKNKHVHLIDKGEAAALALAIILGKDTPLVIDERTTRMLCENPERLGELLEKKLHKNIKSNKNNFSMFEGFKIIRSTELAHIAHKKELFELKDKRMYDAVLYALKYNGCSITDEEIEEMKKI